MHAKNLGRGVLPSLGCNLLPSALLLLVLAADSRADNMRWNKEFGGAFGVAANWEGGTTLNPPPPNSNDVAQFGLTTVSAGTLTLATTQNLESLSIAFGGRFAVALAGIVPGTDYAQLILSGNATLGGALDVSLTGGFAPAASDSFPILSAAAGIIGAFANVANGQRVTTSDGGGSFLIHYGAGSPFNSSNIVFSNFLTSDADFDEDGDVDADDLAKWRLGFGTATGASYGRGICGTGINL